MIDIIDDYNKIDVDTLRVKKPKSIGNKVVFNVYTKTNQVLYIQTPSLHITGKGENVIYVCHDMFVSWIKRLEDAVFDKIKGCYNQALLGKVFISNVRQFDFNDCIKLSFHQDLVIFQKDHSLSSWQDLQLDQEIKAILCLRWVWMNKNFYGLNYQAIQILKMSVAQLSKLLFQNSEEEIKCDQYEKYTKMKKLGIPPPAIRQKMLMDGLTDDDFKAFEASDKPPDKVEKAPQRPSFLNQIMNRDFKLKKTEAKQEDEKEKIMKKISKYVDTTRNVPSLDEVLRAKANLKPLK